MTNRQFAIQLAAVVLLTGAGLFMLFAQPGMQGYAGLGWAGLIGFAALSIMMFMVGRQAAASENKNNFTSAVLGFTMGKMLLTVTILYIYIELAKPEDKLFVIPILGVYVIFTVFETYFMMKLGRMGV